MRVCCVESDVSTVEVSEKRIQQISLKRQKQEGQAQESRAERQSQIAGEARPQA